MRTIIIITFLLSIIGCSNTTQDKEPTMVQETKQILNDYPDTLEKSIHDAKKVQKQYNNNAQELDTKLNEIKRN